MSNINLHFIIFGKILNFEVCKCLLSWQKLAEYGFKFELWNEDRTERFILTNYPFAFNAFKNSRNFAEKADITRYLIIYHYGGYYIDWDVELISVNQFLELHSNNPKGYLIQDMTNMTIAPELLCALPRELFFLKLIKNIIMIYDNNYRNALSTPFYSGPHRMREVFYFIKKKTRQNIIGVKDVFIYDYEEQKSNSQKEPKIERACHHKWIHSWL